MPVLKYRPDESSSWQTVGITADGYTKAETDMFLQKKADKVEAQELKLFGYISPELPNGVKNYIEGNMFHKRVGRVDLGTLNWTYKSDFNYFHVPYEDIVTNPDDGIVYAICSRYAWGNVRDASADKVFSNVGFNYNNQISVKDTDYTTVEAFRTAVTGVYVYYQKATEETYNILDVDSTITRASNPNLLDNPWFTVNQRGQTSYSTAYAYTVDRWKMDDPYMKLDINDDGTITLSETVDGNVDLSQYLEEEVLTSLLNKTLTASILFQDGQLFSTTFNAPSTVLTNWFNLTIESKKLRIFLYPAYEKMRFSIRLYGIGSHAIKAVKLEVGAISTLANDIPPNYAQELAKCQRYFYRIEDLYTTGVYEQMGGNHLAVQTIYFPVTMRTEPSFTFENVYYRNGGSWTALTSTSRYGVDSKKQYIVPSFDVDNLTSQYSYVMRLLNIQFSADL